jgi:hypothetical protein
VPELTTATRTDTLRATLRSPRIQVPLWLALILLMVGITCSTWSWATGDPGVGLVGTGSLISFVPAVLFIERAVWRSLLESLEPRETHD